MLQNEKYAKFKFLIVFFIFVMFAIWCSLCWFWCHGSLFYLSFPFFISFFILFYFIYLFVCLFVCLFVYLFICVIFRVLYFICVLTTISFIEFNKGEFNKGFVR